MMSVVFVQSSRQKSTCIYIGENERTKLELQYEIQETRTFTLIDLTSEHSLHQTASHHCSQPHPSHDLDHLQVPLQELSRGGIVFASL
jgi:hypothetical protein